MIVFYTASPTRVGGLDVWYPDWNTDWTTAACINTPPLPNGRPTYTSQLACCKAHYGGQSSGACLQSLPSPPTASPTGTGGLDVWYADWDSDWTTASCINTAPLPNGRPTYTSQLACCQANYAGQSSGACLQSLPSPPTSSPTGIGGLNVWYADWDSDWTTAACINTAPLPNGRPTYTSQLACCQANYAGQSSGACLQSLPSPPTSSPTGIGGLNVWYADWDNDWTTAACINTAPIPNGRPTFTSQLACCQANYAGQSSGACLQSLPSPPTSSPTGANSPFYPVWASGGFSVSYCDNSPSGLKSWMKTYDTQAECCNEWFPNQQGNFCLRRAPAFGSLAPTVTPVYPYYPKWGNTPAEGRCLNDGAHGWNTYLYDNGYDCCEAWFKKMDGSFGISNCLLALGYTNSPTDAPTKKPTMKPTLA